MIDDVLKAQQLLDQNISKQPKAKRPIINKWRRGGGVGDSKPPYLERKQMVLLSLLILLALMMSFFIGLLVGTLELQRPIINMPQSEIQHTPNRAEVPKTKPIKKAIADTQKPTQSAVMKYRPVKQIRKEKQKDAEASLVAQAKAFGKDSGTFAL